MAHLPLPGELPGGEINPSNGRDIIFINIGHFAVNSGHTLALVTAETSVKVDSTHKTTYMQDITMSTCFASIQPIIYREGARSGAAIEEQGFSMQTLAADNDRGLLRPAGSFKFLRPSTSHGPAVIVASLVEQSARFPNRTWLEIERELPRQILIADEGLETDKEYPFTLAQRVSLDTDERTEIGLVLTEADADEDNQERMKPILWSPDERHETGITVGTIRIDQLRLDDNGRTDWTEIGFSIDGPPKDEPNIAGFVLVTSGKAEQQHILVNSPRRPADIIDINSAHRAG